MTLSDTDKLNYLEELFSKGETPEWKEFMVLVTEYGFRKAIEMKLRKKG